MGSIYSADLTPQRTILIECTPMVCIRCFSVVRSFVFFLRVVSIRQDHYSKTSSLEKIENTHRQRLIKIRNKPLQFIDEFDRQKEAV